MFSGRVLETGPKAQFIETDSQPYFTFYFDVQALNVVFVNLELTLWSSLESEIPPP